MSGLALAATGCAPTADGARAELERLMTDVDAHVEALADTVQDMGLPIEYAGTSIEACQSTPAPGVGYQGGVTTEPLPDYDEAFERASGHLQDGGWMLADSGSFEEHAWAQYESDGFRLSVKHAVFTIGERRVEGRMELSLTREDDCIRVPDGGYIAEVWDLGKDLTPKKGPSPTPTYVSAPAASAGEALEIGYATVTRFLRLQDEIARSGVYDPSPMMEVATGDAFDFAADKIEQDAETEFVLVSGEARFRMLKDLSYGAGDSATPGVYAWAKVYGCLDTSGYVVAGPDGEDPRWGDDPPVTMEFDIAFAPTEGRWLVDGVEPMTTPEDFAYHAWDGDPCAS